ncbi:MAG: hypothetical protein IJQ80_01540 [Clostridia bacterium]|nr:hypothetical protein [Clostridia bacterium]
MTMTREVRADGNVLCEKLCARFGERGVNSPALRQKVSLHKAHEKMVSDAKEARRRSEQSRPAPGFTSAKQRLSGREYRRGADSSFDEGRVFIPDGGRYGLAFAKGYNIRLRAARFNKEEYERRNPTARPAKPAAPKERKASPSLGSIMREKIASLFTLGRNSANDGERFVKRSPVPKGAVAAILLCTALLLVMIYTYSTYTQTVSEGKALREERAELMVEHGKLENMLSLRDNISEIEDYAVNDLGMVKSSLVETRTVSIAGGERIEVVKAEETGEENNIFSDILSAMGSNWERIMDYLG